MMSAMGYRAANETAYSAKYHLIGSVSTLGGAPLGVVRRYVEIQEWVG
jgi:hypothetical protein